MDLISRTDTYTEALDKLEDASRLHLATRSEADERNKARTRAIVEVSDLGVPRSAVAKLASLTGGRVQQILDEAGKTGATGEGWKDPELRRLVEERIAARPAPSAGIGLRRESTLGPHVGPGVGLMVRLTDDVDENREQVIAAVTRLLKQVKEGKLDNLLTLTDEELDVVRADAASDG